jgi:predicted nucleic acid-binding protein
MIVVLDTSALLAHHRDEEGADRVQSLFEDSAIQLLIASVTLTEFGRRMLELGASSEEVLKILSDYKHLLDEVVSIDEETAMKAFSLAEQATKRIPLVDSLIAAVACLKKATLLHRDRHFESIPKSCLETDCLQQRG